MIAFKSIHPVAGQGWNLGIKDIQTLCKLLDQYSLEEKILIHIIILEELLKV